MKAITRAYRTLSVPPRPRSGRQPANRAHETKHRPHPFATTPRGPDTGANGRDRAVCSSNFPFRRILGPVAPTRPHRLTPSAHGVDKHPNNTTHLILGLGADAHANGAARTGNRGLNEGLSGERLLAKSSRHGDVCDECKLTFGLAIGDEGGDEIREEGVPSVERRARFPRETDVVGRPRNANRRNSLDGLIAS